MKRVLISLSLLITIALTANAQTIAVHGWIDGYYAWNDQHPEPRLNFFAGVGTSAHRADRSALNVAALDFARDPKPFGFHITLVSGDSSDIVHAGEPHPRRRLIRNVYQASVSYTAPIGRGVALEAGVYPSHIGFEGFFTKDNWNYSRGWLGELSPYYQTGIKASYAWSDRWSGQIHVLRGWQLIEDNNTAPAIGTQFAYSGPRLSASFNTFVGPELPHDNAHLRRFGDVVATWKATPTLSLGTSVDRGSQDLPGDAAASWLGIAAYGRYTVDPRHAVAIRVERFSDPDAGISGIAQRLTEATMTFELHPDPHLILKLEGRLDHSTAPVFNHSRNQTLAIASAVAAF
jgi:Putative beta-barrel porin-2, OmpL-like. bbp2